MAFVSSNDIYAFPVATRGTDYPLSRLTTEKNITNILNSLVDNGGFVLNTSFTQSITYNSGFEPVSGHDDIEFIIRGYYFKTTISSILNTCYSSQPTGNTTVTIYGAIQIGESGDYTATLNTQLNALSSTNVGEGETVDINNTSTDDEDSQFVGISFENTTPTSEYTDYIPLFNLIITTEGNSTSYVVEVPRDYHYKLNQESINLEWNVLSN